MGVFLIKKSFKSGGSIQVKNSENPETKFNDKPYGQIGINNTLNGIKAPQTIGQSVKPIPATITYGGDLLNKLHFRNKRDKDKNVKLTL